MSQEVDKLMETIVNGLSDANEERRDERNAAAMYDHLCETLVELGYPQEVADDVATTARDRLMELCGA